MYLLTLAWPPATECILLVCIIVPPLHASTLYVAAASVQVAPTCPLPPGVTERRHQPARPPLWALQASCTPTSQAAAPHQAATCCRGELSAKLHMHCLALALAQPALAGKQLSFFNVGVLHYVHAAEDLPSFPVHVQGVKG